MTGRSGITSAQHPPRAARKALRESHLPAIIGSLHRTSTSCHAGEATRPRRSEPYPCPGRHTPPTRGSWPHGHHPAPVAQWIEQVPSKHLAAGSSPAGGARRRPSFGRVFLLVGAISGRGGAPGARAAGGLKSPTGTGQGRPPAAVRAENGPKFGPPAGSHLPPEGGGGGGGKVGTGGDGARGAGVSGAEGAYSENGADGAPGKNAMSGAWTDFVPDTGPGEVAASPLNPVTGRRRPPAGR